MPRIKTPDNLDENFTVTPEIVIPDELDEGFAVTPEEPEIFIPEIKLPDVIDEGFGVFTEEELAEMQAEQDRQNQIGAAHVILNQTDYKILKAAEKLILEHLAATPMTLALGDMQPDELSEIIALRQSQRDVINDLE